MKPVTKAGSCGRPSAIAIIPQICLNNQSKLHTNIPGLIKIKWKNEKISVNITWYLSQNTEKNQPGMDVDMVCFWKEYLYTFDASNFLCPIYFRLNSK